MLLFNTTIVTAQKNNRKRIAGVCKVGSGFAKESKFGCDGICGQLVGHFNVFGLVLDCD